MNWIKKIFKSKTILEYDMLLNIEMAKNKELEQENTKLREALSKIASEEYGRPTEMMLIARKALEKSE